MYPGVLHGTKLLFRKSDWIPYFVLLLKAGKTLNVHTKSHTENSDALSVSYHNLLPEKIWARPKDSSLLHSVRNSHILHWFPLDAIVGGSERCLHGYKKIWHLQIFHYLGSLISKCPVSHPGFEKILHNQRGAQQGHCSMTTKSNASTRQRKLLVIPPHSVKVPPPSTLWGCS